jgi:hypothetical protein
MAAIGIGVIVGIPTFLIALGLRAANALKQQKDGPSYSEEDARVAEEIDAEFKKAVKDYNLADESMRVQILDAIAKSKGYVFKDGRLVKEA